MVFIVRQSINFVILNCVLNIGLHAVTSGENILPQSNEFAPVCAQLTKSQRFLMSVLRYHAGNNDKILASLCALVPAVTCCKFASSSYSASAVTISDSTPRIMLPEQIETNIPTIEVPPVMEAKPAIAPQLAEVPVATDSTSEDSSSSLYREAGSFSAGALSVAFILWHFFGK